MDMNAKIEMGTMVRLIGTDIVGMVASEPKKSLFGKYIFRVHAPKGAVYYWSTNRVEVVSK